MATRNPFAGDEQGDVAFLSLDGIAYRCFVWQRNTQRTIAESNRTHGASIEAAVYVEQPHGDSVLLGRYTVRTPPNGEQVDCPRVVSTAQAFHVHWIEYDPEETEQIDVGAGNFESRASGMDLHRATFDVEDSPYAWVHRGSIPTSYFHLYDTQSLGTDDDYILAHASDIDQISVYRPNGEDWVDNEWVVTQTSLTLTGNVLAVSANREQPLIVYQSGTSLTAFSRLWATGAASQPPTPVSSSFGDFTAVALCQVGSVDDADLFMVAEYEDSITIVFPLSTDIELPTTVHSELDASSLAIPAREFRVRNTTLQSKPWREVSAESLSTPVPQMFAVLGYQDAREDSEWLQSNQYVMRYENDSSAATGRPIPVATLASGIADARKHGRTPVQIADQTNQPTGTAPHKRRNHLPSPSPAPAFGPQVKSITTVLGRWSRIDTSLVDSSSQVGIVVAGAALEATRFHHDDAWSHPYGDNDPPLPTTPHASVGVPQKESTHAGAGLFLSGGTPQTYDGHRFVEAGFPWRPEILDARPDDTAGGPAVGTYSYTAVYEWRDARGSTHRSEPSAPLVVTTDGNATNLEIRCCNISMKDNAFIGASGSPIKIDVYRTVQDGQIFYPLFRGNDGLSKDLANIPQNVPSAHTVQVQDGALDSQISDATPLSFTQVNGDWSPIPGETVPALGAVASWQNRVVGVSSEETKRLWISREIAPEARGEQYTVPEFASALTFRIDQVEGRVVALQEMDNALILFTRDAIYALNGSPADATGQGSTLALQLLQRDTGCVEPRSVAPAPDGIYFQSRRGLYKLTRQNSLEYVGADVEDELRAAGNIRAITVHEDSHQCRVLCNGGPFDSPRVLVYDWLMKLWAVWPLPEASTTDGLSSAVDAVVWRGHVGEHAHAVLQTSGVFVQKASTSLSRYADESGAEDTVAILVDARTGWIHLAGLAGFKRIRKIGLHFTKAAASGLTIQIEYDRDGTQTDGASMQTAGFASPAPAYVEVRTNVQKCTSIRIRILESTGTPSGSQLTESTLNLHAVTLVVARKPGLARVSPTAQRT